jgi:hypothetical protein
VIIDQTTVAFRKMDAGYAGRLSLRHARDGRGDGWGNATGPAIFPAMHKKRSGFTTPKIGNSRY